MTGSPNDRTPSAEPPSERASQEEPPSERASPTESPPDGKSSTEPPPGRTSSAESPPTSVILPSREWTDAAAEVAAQLRPADELLVVHDGAEDPVAGRADDLPGGVRLVAANEPEGCSGKANAVAAGMAAAEHDRLVWTDDDFRHPPGWLADLHDDYDRHGPVTEVPFFVGRDPLAVLLEPVYALGGTLGVYASGKAWAGAVAFERSDLDAERFLSELRRTVSDDGLLSEHLEVTPLRRVRRVAAGGTLRATLERHVRFGQIVRRHDPSGAAAMAAVLALVVALCLFVPVYGVGATTLAVGAVYVFFGLRRWTFLLAAPGLAAALLLFPYVHARRTFVWAGRRYRWRSKFDVGLVD